MYDISSYRLVHVPGLIVELETDGIDDVLYEDRNNSLTASLRLLNYYYSIFAKPIYFS